MRSLLLAICLFFLPGFLPAAEPAKIQTLEEALRQSATLEFREATLTSIGEWLGKTYHVEVVMDEKALADAALSPTDKLTGKTVSEPLGLALSKFLAPHHLGWTRYNDTLRISTLEQCQYDHVLHIYRPAAGQDVKTLCERIKKEYKPKDWERQDQKGARGWITLYGKAIVIGYTSADHFALAHKYRDVLSGFSADGSSLMPPALLRRRDFEFREAKLSDIAEWLRKETGLPVDIDENSLKEDGLSVDQRISLRLRNATLEQALDALPALGWWHYRGRIVITTEELADTTVIPCVLDTRGLLNDEAFSDLEDILHVGTPGEFFSEMSGPPMLYEFAEPHYLLCKVPYRGQRQVAKLMEELRWALKK